MPRTVHGVADHEAVDEWTMVVRAVGPHRKHLSPEAHQQNLLSGGMTGKHAPVLKLSERDALHQIGAAGLGLILSHYSLLPEDLASVLSARPIPHPDEPWRIRA
jgi:hypothetical protein